jgi:LysR family transcriptional regulator, carnitine catabolism transcriptional activator
MDLRRLRMFLAVIDNGTVTRAAAACFVSQPALSQAIRELEQELGVALFERVGRSIKPTAAGEALVGPARQVFRELESARAAVTAVEGLEAGRVDLACLPTLAVDPTAVVVGTFRSQHPAVTVHMANPEDPDELLAMVRTGVVEVGITEEPAAAADLAVTPLGDQELRVVLPPSWPPFSGRLGLRRLDGVPVVTTPPGTSSRRHMEQAFARVDVVPQIAVETSQREAIVPLVLSGAGVALLPRPLAETARRSGAVTADIRPKEKRSVVLLHRRADLSPAAARFKELAVERAL